MRDSNLFEKAVKQYFEPMARKYNFPLIRVRDGVYDILSPCFIMRIRLHTGHARGLNVILREASLREFDEKQPFIQYGIGCFMEFCGEGLPDTFISVNSDSDFLKQARLLAEVADRFGIPYLLGQGKDFDAIKKICKEKADEQRSKIEGYHFPKNVRKEWI